MSTNVSYFCLYFILLECLFSLLAWRFPTHLGRPNSKTSFLLSEVLPNFLHLDVTFFLSNCIPFVVPLRQFSWCLYLLMSRVVLSRSQIIWPSRTRPFQGIWNFSGTQYRLTLGAHCWVQSSVFPSLWKMFHTKYINWNVRTKFPGIRYSFSVISYFPFLLSLIVQIISYKFFRECFL